MNTSAAKGDSILGWGTLVLTVGGAVAVHELGWRWDIVLGWAVAYVALLAWRRPRGGPRGREAGPN